MKNVQAVAEIVAFHYHRPVGGTSVDDPLLPTLIIFRVGAIGGQDESFVKRLLPPLRHSMSSNLSLTCHGRAI